MGVALGSMGMSLSDFDALMPDEFDAIYKAWERTCIREDWERVRFLARCILQPYSKRGMKPTDIVKFSWDDEHDGPAPIKMSKEDAHKEFDRLKQILHE